MGNFYCNSLAMKTKSLASPFLALMMAFSMMSCEQADVEPESPKPADTEGDGLLLHAGTIRGSLDGPALRAQFDSPYLMSEGPDKSLYVYDAGGHFEVDGNLQNRKIRKISADGQVTTIFDLAAAGFPGSFQGISGMTVDKNGYIYISHEGRIKKISPDGKNITVIAGTGEGVEVPMKDGPALQATFFGPAGLTFSKSGCLYIMDSGNNAVRLLVNGKVSTIAGGIRYWEEGDEPRNQLPKDGIGPNAEFDNPLFIAVDDHDNVYVTGGKHPLIRKVTPGGVVTNFLAEWIDYSDYYYDSDFYTTYTGISFAKNGILYVNANSANGKGDDFVFSINELTLNGELTRLLLRSYLPFDPENESNVPGLYFPTGLAVIGDTLYTTSTSDHLISKLKLK